MMSRDGEKEYHMSEHSVEVSAATFDSEVLEADGPVLVDFWAPWCAPCRMQTPIIEEWVKARAGQVKLAKLNTEEAPDLATRFGIRSIPTLIVFQDGQPLVSAIGVQSADNLDRLLEEAAKRREEVTPTA